MARAMGIDPATRRYVPFDIVDKKFATNFFDLVIHPLERQGVDFWWLDWQQSDKTSLEGINPTWWLNYTFFTDMERQGKHRPLIFHRWGGLGSHRYQVGFSGDTYSTWQSLGTGQCRLAEGGASRYPVEPRSDGEPDVVRPPRGPARIRRLEAQAPRAARRHRQSGAHAQGADEGERDLQGDGDREVGSRQ